MRLVACLLCLLIAGPVFGAVRTEEVAYTLDGNTFKGVVAWDDAVSGTRPGVLVIHEWWGCNPYAVGRARMLAELGYVAFACDMFGDGKTADTPDQAQKLVAPFSDNTLRLARVNAALDVLRARPETDPARIAAIGYCFGGTSVLRLACSGSDVKAVVSFHGSLWDITEQEAASVRTRVLICNGAADPFIPVPSRAAFIEKLENAGADYQFIEYGGAEHSFTNPGVDAHAIPGAKYDADADRRSWAHMRQLFDEAFAQH